MTTKTALFIDPGIDDTGVAAFKLPKTEGILTSQAILRGLLWTDLIVTAPDTELPERLADLAHETTHLVRKAQPVYVVIEAPVYHGDYGDDNARRRSVNKLYMAMSAVMVASALELDGLGEVRTSPAIRQPKDVRHELLRTAAKSIGLPLPSGPRGGQREDQLDAIWLGLQWINEKGTLDAKTA